MMECKNYLESEQHQQIAVSKIVKTKSVLNQANMQFHSSGISFPKKLTDIPETLIFIFIFKKIKFHL